MIPYVIFFSSIIGIFYGLVQFLESDPKFDPRDMNRFEFFMSLIGICGMLYWAFSIVSVRVVFYSSNKISSCKWLNEPAFKRKKK